MSASRPLPDEPGRRILRLLAACRGEAALRISQTAHAAGIESVVLIQESDAEALWPDEADYSVWVPEVQGPAWPDPERVVSAGVDAGCDAIHPGWEGVVRSPLAAELVVRSGMAWLGPSLRALEAVADRGAQRAVAERLKIPLVPGSEPVSERSQVQTWLAWAGQPALLKPVDTLGLPGRSLRIDSLDEVAGQVGDILAEGPVVVERLVLAAREIEVPVLAGADGRVATLSDRETTVRSGTDRLLVESPAAGLSPALRATLHRDAARIAEALGWQGSGSVRFLLTSDQRAWFLGLRPGLRPWHGATELSLDVDLVAVELGLAGGADLAWEPADLVPRGHCISLRLPLAEDSVLDAIADLPDDVRVTAAGVAGDRLRAGEICGTLSLRAPTRQACIVRARAILDRWPMAGLVLDDGPLRRLLEDRAFWKAPLDREMAAQRTGLGARALPGQPMLPD